MKRETATAEHQLYRHFDAAGQLLYVGMSVNFSTRLGGHKSAPWFSQIASVTVEHFKTRPEALAAERAAIQAEKPTHNSNLTGNLDKRKARFTPDDDVAEMLAFLKADGFSIHRFFNDAVRARFHVLISSKP